MLPYTGGGDTLHHLTSMVNLTPHNHSSRNVSRLHGSLKYMENNVEIHCSAEENFRTISFVVCECYFICLTRPEFSVPAIIGAI